MKSVRLPETDLANLAFQSPGKKRDFLANWIKPKRIEGSYEPFRRSLGEAANVELPLIAEIAPTSLAQLEQLVLRECKGDGTLEAMNLLPVKSLRAFMEAHNAEAQFLHDLPITLYPGMRYSFWAPLLIKYHGVWRVAFMDLRRKGNLTGTGLHVCLSLMHERFRVLNPDLASLGVEAWRYADNATRSIHVIREWAPPITFKSITDDVAETYEILNGLRSAGTPRTGTDDGPLFGERPR